MARIMPYPGFAGTALITIGGEISAFKSGAALVVPGGVGALPVCVRQVPG